MNLENPENRTGNGLLSLGKGPHALARFQTAIDRQLLCVIHFLLLEL